MPNCAIDQAASTITLRTRAKGLLSRLAHDLEIDVAEFDGEVTLDGERWSGELTVPVRHLRVSGVVKREQLDRGVLSASDVQEIERRIHNEVLPAREIRVSLSGNASSGEAEVTTPSGRQTLRFNLKREERRDGEQVGSGKLKLSMRALGIAEIKAPLGAFKVADTIEVAFWIMLHPPSTEA